MGVDYDAVFGIGYKLKANTWEDYSEVEELIETSKYKDWLEVIVWGDTYVDDDIDLAVVLTNRAIAKDLTGLEKDIKTLKGWLIENKIEFIDNFNIVGGLSVSILNTSTGEQTYITIPNN